MGTILWLAILFFGILLFPWLLVLLLRILLKRYRFQIWPVGFLCYSHGRMVIPCTQCITLVLTFRHLSISLNWSRPFVTFRLRGFKAHFVQYNILKDPNINQYANDLKTQFLMEMKKKFSTGSVPIVVESPAPSTNKLSQSLFDRIEGIIEEADVQFVDVRNDQEKREAIAKFYGQIDRAPDKVFGDFNGYLPVASVVASYGDGNFSLAAQVSVMVKKTVNVSIEAKSGHIKMYSVELNRLIFFIVDYVNQDTLYANFRRYSRLAQMRTAGLRLVQSARSALETLSVSVKSITAVIYGYTYKRRKDMKADYKFPPTDFSFILPKFGLSYDNSKPNVSASTLTLG